MPEQGEHSRGDARLVGVDLPGMQVENEGFLFLAIDMVQGCAGESVRIQTKIASPRNR